ncbi:hypothetical protein [Burkholderia thailandensis]|uniref:hypothetical protein n=1 Tax=Burkholderia thailandensis TaxID=57975 RepID=UPI0015E112FA|nr:hypothetical protein [Burkholderia thailandensis]
MVPLARAAARRVLDAAGAPARRRLKSIRDDATRRGAVDITHIARASSLACRCRRIRDRRRACGPMRVALTALTALAARAARTAGHGRNSPRIGACRRIADAIGEYAPARQGGARRGGRRAARNAAARQGARGTGCRRKLRRCNARAFRRRAAARVDSVVKKSARRGTEHQNVRRCMNGSGYLDDLDDSDDMRERVAVAQCSLHVMPPRRLSQTSVFGGRLG